MSKEHQPPVDPELPRKKYKPDLLSLEGLTQPLMSESIIKNKKWLWIAAVLFVVFLVFTPINLFHSWGYFLTFVEALLCGFLVFMATLGLNNFGEILNLNEDDPDLSSRSVILSSGLTVLVGCLAFGLFTSMRTDARLKDKGITTQATIDDGSMSISRGSIRRKSQTSYEVQISFKLENGTISQHTKNVSQDIYDNVSLGQEVLVIYLPDNPDIFELVVGNKNVKEFTGISNRDLTFADLEAILDMPLDSAQAYLNKISMRWDISQEGTVQNIFNESKKDMISRDSLGTLVYESPQLNNIDGFLMSVKILQEKKETKTDDPELASKVIRTFKTENSMARHTFSVSKKMKIGNYLLVTKIKSK